MMAPAMSDGAVITPQNGFTDRPHQSPASDLAADLVKAYRCRFETRGKHLHGLVHVAALSGSE